MNYQKVYDKLVKRAQLRQKANPIEGYKERHHIIPRCMGGLDTKENIVELTAREHFIIHQLLVKVYPKHRGLLYALKLMSGARGARLYEWVRIKMNEAGCRPPSRKGCCGPNLGKSPSIETRLKLREANLGKKLSPETRAKISADNKRKGKKPPNATGRRYTKEQMLTINEKKRETRERNKLVKTTNI